jgi:hypothetical protein
VKVAERSYGDDENPGRGTLVGLLFAGRRYCYVLGRKGRIGGAERDRTDDLLSAIQALSQLSYSPTMLESIAANDSAPSENSGARIIGAGCGRGKRVSCDTWGMKKTFVLFVLALAVSAFGQTFPPMTQLPTGAAQLEPSLSSTSFTFVVAGDNRPAHDGDPLTKPLLDIVDRLAANPPEFVIWNGDSVFGKQDVGIDQQYAQFLAAFKPLSAALFNAPGNHEMVVQTMIACGTKSDPYNGELPDFSGSMMADYETSMGPPYGMFRYGNAAFLVINTDDVLDVTLTNACAYNGYVGKAQLAALQATLDQLAADTTIAHVFCFMHRPIKDKGGSQIGAPKGDTSDYGKQVEAFRQLLDAGKYAKMTFVFASHDHLLYVDPKPARPNGPFSGSVPNKGKPVFIVTGGAGAPLSDCKNGKGTNPGAYYHYTTVTVNGSNVTVNVVPLYGTTPCGSGTIAGGAVQ